MAATLFNASPPTPPSQQFTSTTNAWAAVGLTDSECGLAGEDTTPPAAPTVLTASPGDGNVSLDWNDSGESDLDGFNVYRSTDGGTTYAQINNLLIRTRPYTDNDVTNGDTYYYVVTAVDTSDNESENSASATPSDGGGGVEPTMHVQSIVLTTVDQGGGFKQAQATVTIVDNLGEPVFGANVTGIFSGDIDETVTDATDGNGVVVLKSNDKKGRLKFAFCVYDVIDVIYSTLTYDGVETCP